MSADIRCPRCRWFTYSFERYCHVCGYNRWDRDHISVPRLWHEVTA